VSLAYISECYGALAPGTITCGSGHTFSVSGNGYPVYTVVAACYNDWPVDGLVDDVTMSGWFTDGNHCVVIRAAAGHGHNGTFTDAGGQYTGFALKIGWPYGIKTTAVPHTRVHGLIMDGASLWLAADGGANRMLMKGRILQVTGIGATVANSVSVGCGQPAFSASSGVGDEHQLSIPAANVSFYNCTAVDCGTGFYPGAGLGKGNTRVRFVNCMARPRAGGIGFKPNKRPMEVSYCASSDGTADDWNIYREGREGNLVNQRFTFVDEANDDFRLAETDTGAQGWGVPGFGADIEGGWCGRVAGDYASVDRRRRGWPVLHVYDYGQRHTADDVRCRWIAGGSQPQRRCDQRYAKCIGNVQRDADRLEQRGHGYGDTRLDGEHRASAGQRR